MRFLISGLFVCGFTALGFAGTAEEDWKKLVALDAGPAASGRDAGKAFGAASAHLKRQENALRSFLAEHPADSRAWEARLRLARVLNLQARLDGGAVAAEVNTLFAELERTAKGSQIQELEFAKLAQHMRRWQGRRVPPGERDALLKAARNFYERFPSDRRVPALFVEIGRLFENRPEVKAKLLKDAAILNQDPGLKEEIADELKRMAWLNTVLDVPLRGLEGESLNPATLSGKPLLLVFFSAVDEPSAQMLLAMRKAVLPFAEKVKLLPVSLDQNRRELDAFVKSKRINEAIAWENKGWESPLIRRLGLNAIPTVWLLDAKGVVRSLDPVDDLKAALEDLGKPGK